MPTYFLSPEHSMIQEISIYGIFPGDDLNRKAVALPA